MSAATDNLKAPFHWLAQAGCDKITGRGRYQRPVPKQSQPFEEVTMSERNSICAPEEKPEVEYRDIPGFPGYRAGDDGIIWSCLKSVGSRWHNDRRMEPVGKWKPLTPERRKEDDRARHTLRNKSGRLVRRYRSHFVLLAFKGPCPDGLECCHDDGNCLNDRPGNLRWDTSAANKADMLRHGTRPMGESHSSVKLSDADIACVLSRRGEPLAAIAKDYDVTVQRIHQILKKGSR